MTTILHLAKPSDAGKLYPLVTRFHEEFGLETTEEGRAAALTPLLTGSPHGAVYLIGPTVSPVGYLVVCFGWSIELGGLEGFLDELYIRPRVRGRGMAREALSQLHTALGAAGVKSLTLEVDGQDPRAQRLYGSLGYEMRERYRLMQRPL